MENRALLEFRVKTLAERIGLWFVVWGMSLFRDQLTEVITESPMDDGSYLLPFCLGSERFGALIQDVHPVMLVCRTNKLTIRMDLHSSMFEMIALDDTSKRVFDLIKQQIMALKSVPKVSIPALGYDHRGIVATMKSAYWAEKIASAMSVAGPLTWLPERSAKPGSGDPVTRSHPALIYAGEGSRFILYNRANDRLIAGSDAPDIWEALR